jgi:hypothetical protein
MSEINANKWIASCSRDLEPINGYWIQISL